MSNLLVDSTPNVIEETSDAYFPVGSIYRLDDQSQNARGTAQAVLRKDGTEIASARIKLEKDLEPNFTASFFHIKESATAGETDDGSTPEYIDYTLNSGDINSGKYTMEVSFSGKFRLALKDVDDIKMISVGQGHGAYTWTIDQ